MHGSTWICESHAYDIVKSTPVANKPSPSSQGLPISKQIDTVELLKAVLENLMRMHHSSSNKIRPYSNQDFTSYQILPICQKENRFVYVKDHADFVTSEISSRTTTRAQKDSLNRTGNGSV